MKNNPTLAAIDLGSNSFRLLVAPLAGPGLRPLCKELRPVRLAEGLGTRRRLSPAALARGAEALAAFRHLLDRYQPHRIIARGTAALRQAENSDEFLHTAARILACPVAVLGGEEEAALALAGVLHGFPVPPPAPLWVFDVGGGSTEAINPAPGNGTSVSLPLGAVNLTETFFSDSQPPEIALRALGKRIRELLVAARLPLLAGTETPPTLIGSGGTATALAALDLELKKYDDSRVHGHILSRTRLAKLVATLAPLSPTARNLLPGLGQGRGEIILAGAAIFQELLDHFAAPQLLISDSGLLEGLWLSGRDQLP